MSFAKVIASAEAGEAMTSDNNTLQRRSVVFIGLEFYSMKHPATFVFGTVIGLFERMAVRLSRNSK